MRLYGRVRRGNGEPLLEHMFIADSFWSRFLGLMGRPALQLSEGLLLTNTSSIHTCFMRFPIDVVCLNENYETLHIETVHPWRVGSIVKQTKHVLELSAGKAAVLEVGERLCITTGTAERTTKKE